MNMFLIQLTRPVVIALKYYTYTAKAVINLVSNSVYLILYRYLHTSSFIRAVQKLKNKLISNKNKTKEL